MVTSPWDLLFSSTGMEIGRQEHIRLIIFSSKFLANIEQGKWHFVVLTAAENDPSVVTDDECKAYLDGQFLGTLPFRDSGVSDITEVTTIGIYKGANYQLPFYGGIDEVAVFDRVLTPEEIEQLYQNGLNGLGYGETPVANLRCVGFEPPMAAGPVTVKKNRALPHKAHLFDADGLPVTDAGIAAPPVIQVLYQSGTGEAAIDVTDDALAAGEGTDGNQFVCTEDEKWQFNLKTKNYTASGAYTVSMESGDDSEYAIDPTCEATFVIK